MPLLRGFFMVDFWKRLVYNACINILCFIIAYGDKMIKKLLLLVTLSSTLTLADDLPEPGLATPAYNPPPYTPAPVYAPPAYTPPNPLPQSQAAYTTGTIIVSSQSVYVRQPVTYYSQPIAYKKYPMVTNHLGYDGYSRQLRQR